MDGINTSVFFQGLHKPQAEAMSATLDALSANEKKILIEAPTRWGKMVLAWRLLEGLYQINALPQILITAHTRDARAQWMKEGPEWAPTLFEDGVIEAITTMERARTSSSRVVIMTKQLVSMLQAENSDYLKRFAAVIQDEAHKDLSDKSLVNYNSTSANLIAITATSAYSEAKSLERAGYKKIYSMSIPKAVEAGVIVPIKNILIEISDATKNLDQIPVVGNDFEPDALGRYLEEMGAFVKVGQVFAARAKMDINAGRKVKVSMGFAGTINSARRLAQMVNEVWKQNIGDNSSYSTSQLWASMPIPVRDYFIKNDMEAEVGPVAVPIWGVMPDGVRKYILDMHRSGEIPFVSNADLLIHAYTNKRVADIHNVVPTLSGVVAGQRPGRAFGLDDEDPDKEAIIFDYVFPSRKRQQITYGKWAGGFLFEKTYDHSRKRETEKDYVPFPLDDVPNIKVIADERDIRKFIRHSELVSKASRMSSLSEYPLHIAVAMVEAGVTNQTAFFQAARSHLRQSKMLDDPYWRQGATQGKILATLQGRLAPVGEYGYTPAAIICSAVLRKPAKDIFETKVGRADILWRDMGAITKRTQEAYINNVNGPDPQLFLESEQLAISTEDPEVQRGLAEIWGNEPDAIEITFQQQLADAIKAHLQSLKPTHERILRQRFGINTHKQTLDSIAWEIDRHRENVRQKEHRAITIIKEKDKQVRFDAAVRREEARIASRINLSVDEEQASPIETTMQKRGLQFEIASHYPVTPPGQIAKSLLPRVEALKCMDRMTTAEMKHFIDMMPEGTYSEQNMAYLSNLVGTLIEKFGEFSGYGHSEARGEVEMRMRVFGERCRTEDRIRTLKNAQMIFDSLKSDGNAGEGSEGNSEEEATDAKTEMPVRKEADSHPTNEVDEIIVRSRYPRLKSLESFWVDIEP